MEATLLALPLDYRMNLNSGRLRLHNVLEQKKIKTVTLVSSKHSFWLLFALFCCSKLTNENCSSEKSRTTRKKTMLTFHILVYLKSMIEKRPFYILKIQSLIKHESSQPKSPIEKNTEKKTKAILEPDWIFLHL